MSTFTTDFGVTFGMINSFDILFKTPSIELVQKNKVNNILFSAFWFGGMPFLTGITQTYNIHIKKVQTFGFAAAGVVHA